MEKPDAVAARHGRRELSCAELLARMESARNADKSGRAPSDLDQAATWVAHWRARVDTPPPVVVARPPEVDAAIAAASLALRECAGLYERERMASCSAARRGGDGRNRRGASRQCVARLPYARTALANRRRHSRPGWKPRTFPSPACPPRLGIASPSPSILARSASRRNCAW